MDRYRNNPFHLLGVPASASLRDAHREADRLLRLIDLGGKPQPAIPVPVIPAPSPNRDEVARALRELEDPVRRIRHEMYWLGAEHESLDRLVNLARSGGLKEFFSDAESGIRWGGDLAPRIRRLMAVICHAAAIEVAREADRERLAAAGRWDLAFEHWLTLQRDDRFWGAMETRARVINDPRLGRAEIAALRQELSADILSANVEIGHQAERDQRPAAFDFQIAKITASPFEPQERDAALRRLLEPVQAQFDAALQSVRAKLADSAIAQHKSSRSSLHAYLWSVEEEFNQGAMASISHAAGLPSEFLPATEILDQAADILRALAVTWNNDGDCPSEGLRVIQVALGYVVSPAQRARIQGDRDTLERNFKALTGVEVAAIKVKPPAMRTFNGVGTKLYGRRDLDPATGSYVATLYFVFLFVPLFPIRAYRVIPASGGGWYFQNWAPVGRRAKAWGWIVAAMAVFVILAAIAGEGPSPNATAASEKPSVVAVYNDKARLGTWIDGESARLKAEEADLGQEKNGIEIARGSLGDDPTQDQIDQFNRRVAAFTRRIAAHNKAVANYNSQVDKYHAMP